jgi:hypothetical protein
MIETAVLVEPLKGTPALLNNENFRKGINSIRGLCKYHDGDHFRGSNVPRTKKSPNVRCWCIPNDNAPVIDEKHKENVGHESTNSAKQKADGHPRKHALSVNCSAENYMKHSKHRNPKDSPKEILRRIFSPFDWVSFNIISAFENTLKKTYLLQRQSFLLN